MLDNNRYLNYNLHYNIKFLIWKLENCKKFIFYNVEKIMVRNAKFKYLTILVMTAVSLVASVVIAIALEIYRKSYQPENSRGIPAFYNIFAWVICAMFIAVFVYLIIKRHKYHAQDFICAGVLIATWGGAAIHYYTLSRVAVSPLSTKTIINTFGVFFKEKVVLYGLNSPDDYLETFVQVHVNFELLVSLVMLIALIIATIIVASKSKTNKINNQ